MELDPNDFPVLEHLSLHDEIRNGARHYEQDPYDESVHYGEWKEKGRVYSDLAKFVSGLPALRKLWLNEDALLGRERGDSPPDSEYPDWLPATHETISQFFAPTETSTVAYLKGCLRTLTSVRVGLGPLDYNLAASFFSLLGENVEHIGFEYNWLENPGGLQAVGVPYIFIRAKFE